MSGTAFWFYLSSEYFPRAPFVKQSANALFTSREEEIRSMSLEFTPKLAKGGSSREHNIITEKERKELQKLKNVIKSKEKEWKLSIWSSHVETRKRNEKEPKAEYNMDDDQWILENRSKVHEFALNHASIDWSENVDALKKIELEDLISILEGEQAKITEKNREGFSKLKENFFNTIQEKAFLHPKGLDLEDPLVDLKVKVPEEENFITLLEQKQVECRDSMKAEEKDRYAGKRPITVTNDADCQICNDGDYTDDNKIVFCSVSYFC